MSSTTVERRSLGRTDIMVTPIGLGAMELSGGGKALGRMFPKLPQEEKSAIVKAALDGGINWIDTAELYGSGVSEAAVSAGLKAAGKTSDDVVVATKWWPLFRTARNITKTIEDRIRYLDGFRIDLYMVHQPISFSSPEAEMDAMAELVSRGKIRSVGVSNFNEKRMRRAHARLQRHGLTLAVNQMNYSLVHRNIETNGVLAAAKELGVTIIAYTPLGSGLLTGKYHKDPSLLSAKKGLHRGTIKRMLEPTRPLVEALEEIGRKYDATPGQVALNWVINFNGDTVVTIPGATKEAHARESAAAMRFRLTEPELAQLDELSRGIGR